MAAVPPEVRRREHRRHNLHEIAWRTVPADEPTTLDYVMADYVMADYVMADYVMADYVGHLRHHLRQIRALLGEGTARDAPAL